MDKTLETQGVGIQNLHSLVKRLEGNSNIGKRAKFNGMNLVEFNTLNFPVTLDYPFTIMNYIEQTNLFLLKIGKSMFTAHESLITIKQ